nr:hypothetical protein [Campylobacter jejuni]
MTLDFDFIYNADNDIFEYLLRFYAKNYNYILSKEENTYHFSIDADEENLKTFCDSLNFMSHSVFLKKFDVKAGQGFNPCIPEDKEFSRFSYITHLNSNAYQEKKLLNKNEWGVFCELRLNAMFRKNHNLDFSDFKIRLARDLFCFALGLKLFENEYKFLSVKKIEEYQKDFYISALDEQVVVLEGFEFINAKARELIFSKEDKNMARISYLVSRYKEKAFILELSKDYEDILLINKELNLLKLCLPKHSKELYEEIKKDEIGARLLENFNKEFPLLDENFKLQNNFYSLLGLLGRVLNLGRNLQESASELLKIADESKMPRGVKIDYRLKEDKSFDYTRTLRSAMSFMLAGVDSANIAYGAVESLAYFLRDTYDELREKKQSDLALISGSLFEHKSLLKNTLKHLKNCQLSDVPLRI